MPIAIKLESSDEIAQVGYQAVSSAHGYVILAIQAWTAGRRRQSCTEGSAHHLAASLRKKFF